MFIRSRGFIATMLAVLVVTAGLSAGAYAASSDPWDAEDCTLSLTGDEVLLSWTSGSTSESYDIWRNGKIIASTIGPNTYRDFTEFAGLSGVVHYSVAGKTSTDTQVPREYCGKIDFGAPDGGTAQPPASCDAAVVSGNFEITWPAADGAEAYVVSRSVDGSPFYWRGRTADTSITDGLRPGDITYQVASRSANGTRSAATQCSGGGDGGDPPNGACRTEISRADAFSLALPYPPAVDQAILDQFPLLIDSVFVGPDGLVYYIDERIEQNRDFLVRVDLATGETEDLQEVGIAFETHKIQHVDRAGGAYIDTQRKDGSYKSYFLNGEETDLGFVDSVGLGTGTTVMGDLSDGRTVLVSNVDGVITKVELFNAVTGERTSVPYPANNDDFPVGLTADDDLVSANAGSGFRLDLDCNG